MAESTIIKVAKLEQKMTDVSSQVSKLDIKVDRVLSKLDNLTELRNEIDLLKQELSTLKKKTFRNGWVFPTLSAVAGSVLTFLIISYFATNR